MTLLRTPRFWLMTTAALILSAGAQAADAQVGYQAGAPMMVAAAPSFPTIAPEQIARDVTTSYNPRTGQTEFVAGSFDAFEDDASLAGAVRLRSADSAVSIDGQPLRDGALLEVDFYYNSPSDDPYGGRGYGDASFISGELAPVVLRDSRILECSTRVENVVYDHASYYGRSHVSGLYRPYRHYTGHNSFGFGFGSNYFGPGYGYYGRNRATSRGYTRGSRNLGRVSRGVTRGGNSSRRGNTSRNRRNGNSDRATQGDTPRSTRQGLSERQIENRLSRIESYDGVSRVVRTRGNGQGATGATRRRNSPMRGVNAEPRLELATPAAQSQAATPQTPTRRNTRRQRNETRAQPRSETRSEPRAEPSAPPKRETRSSPARERRATPPKRETRKAPKQRSTSRNSARRQLDFFPGDIHGGRNVVTSRSVDCAREDKLRVFIPNERLDAARFDGLTVIALDSQGGETPIYLPPNYIEGYRLAASGQIRPQGSTSAPRQTQTQQYNPQPRRVIESAACPSGTSKQADGTCLQSSLQGYPTR